MPSTKSTKSFSILFSMRFSILFSLAAAFFTFGLAGAAHAIELPAGLPDLPTSGPALCVGAYLTPEQGKLLLDYCLAQTPTRAAFEARGEMIRKGILRGAGLDPLPRRTPLHPIVRGRRIRDGYSVENVALETVPGFYLTGNLYRPLKPEKSMAGILCPHGHSAPNKKVKPDSPEYYDPAGRFAEYTQARAASLARMGAVVFTYEMFGWGETAQQVTAEAHRSTLALPMQIWDSMRALDYLLSIDGVDPKRIAVTGESGGGTQTFLLTALDPRVRVAAPCVMVSSYFFGGCACESGRPIHRDAGHFTCNAEIAALAAPRPLLVISDGADWTQHVPAQEFPYLQKIYALYRAQKLVENAHFPQEKHDYGPNKRAAAYRFLAKYLDLNPGAIQNEKGEIDESWFAPERSQAMRVFGAEYPYPANALKHPEEVEAALKSLQQ